MAETRLTGDEREAIENAWIISPKDGPSGPDDPMYLAVEAILTARTAPLRAEVERRVAAKRWWRRRGEAGATVVSAEGPNRYRAAFAELRREQTPAPEGYRAAQPVSECYCRGESIHPQCPTHAAAWLEKMRPAQPVSEPPAALAPGTTDREVRDQESTDE